MKSIALTLLTWACVASAQGQDIVEVLRSSQQKRLDAMMPAADGPRTEAVRASFDALRRVMPAGLEVELRVVGGPLVAETLHGRIVVANERLGDLNEGERRFVLAHELGHVITGHWMQMANVYRRWVPGAVTPEKTDPVAGPLGREASGLAHRQEFEADLFALHLIRSLGHPSDDARSAFIALGMTQDTATHPGTRKRVAALQAADMAPPALGGNAE
jgi:Zn-dependent protease with chaperone function